MTYPIFIGEIKMITRMFVAATLVSIALSGPVQAKQDEIVVYSARKEHLIKPLFDEYTKETGVKISYTTAGAGELLERLKAEGENTQADLFLTVDAGNLWQAAEEGVLRPVNSEKLTANVPANLRDPQNRWFGLSVRARTIVYNTQSEALNNLTSYEALAEETWKSKLVLRTSKKVYNQSLVASLIADHGTEKAESIVAGWVNNLAVDPFSNDTKALEAVAAGIGDATIVNTYYFGRLMDKKPDLPLAIYWPNQDSTGVHVNVSGGGVTAHADNGEGATALLEWLSGAEAQKQFGALNMEYPVNPAVESDERVKGWGDFTANPLNVAKYGELQAEAIKLMDRVGYK